MTISINGIRENENDKTIFFTIAIDDPPVVYKWHADVPFVIKNVKAYLLAKEDNLHLLIHMKEYPDSDYLRFKTDENTELEAMHEWIAEGCKNEDGTVIEKVEWKSTHPDWVGITEEKEHIIVETVKDKVRQKFISSERDMVSAIIETWLKDKSIGKEKGIIIFKAKDAFGEREGIRIESSGSEAKISFFGENAITQQSHIEDADGTLADITMKFNMLLACIENFGLNKKS